MGIMQRVADNIDESEQRCPVRVRVSFTNEQIDHSSILTKQTTTGPESIGR
jgi:hypothetical protein